MDAVKHISDVLSSSKDKLDDYKKVSQKGTNFWLSVLK